jgi:hypothetical protein
MRKRFGRATAIALSGVMVIAGVALADVAVVDGDLVTSGVQETLALGSVCPSSTALPPETVNYYAKRTNQPGRFANGAVLTFAPRTANPVEITTQPISGNGSLTATRPAGTDASRTLSATWESLANDTLSQAMPGSVTVTPGTVDGAYSAEVKTAVSGDQAGGGTRTVNADLTVTWTVDSTLSTCGSAPSFTFDGFYSPVNGNSTDDATFNVRAKAGQGMALKWNLWDGSDRIIVANLYSARSTPLPCFLGVAEAAADTVTAGSSGFRYDADNLQAIYVWNTNKNWATTCRTLELSYNGEVVALLNVQFTK